jgi:bifunctional DNA-binding transcriptional regulator/antitoxin component of YhaV-PrlF toxin-antitoxin module
MAVVRVDNRGRMTIPKEARGRGTRAVIINAGSFFIGIPLPKTPYLAAKDWLVSERTRRDLKDLAEKAGKADAVNRAKRKKQI